MVPRPMTESHFAGESAYAILEQEENLSQYAGQFR